MVIIRSPSDAIFSQLFIFSQEMGFRTYDYLPMKNVAMPFVYIGEVSEQDRRTKRILYGDMQITLHVYGGYKQRKIVTGMLHDLKMKIINMNKIGEMNVNVRRTTGQTLIDNSTSTTMLHGLLEVELSFN